MTRTVLTKEKNRELCEKHEANLYGVKYSTVEERKKTIKNGFGVTPTESSQPKYFETLSFSYRNNNYFHGATVSDIHHPYRELPSFKDAMINVSDEVQAFKEQYDMFFNLENEKNFNKVSKSNLVKYITENYLTDYRNYATLNPSVSSSLQPSLADKKYLIEYLMTNTFAIRNRDKGGVEFLSKVDTSVPLTDEFIINYLNSEDRDDETLLYSVLNVHQRQAIPLTGASPGSVNFAKKSNAGRKMIIKEGQTSFSEIFSPETSEQREQQEEAKASAESTITDFFKPVKRRDFSRPPIFSGASSSGTSGIGIEPEDPKSPLDEDM